MLQINFCFRGKANVTRTSRKRRVSPEAVTGQLGFERLS